MLVEDCELLVPPAQIQASAQQYETEQGFYLAPLKKKRCHAGSFKVFRAYSRQGAYCFFEKQPNVQNKTLIL